MGYAFWFFDFVRQPAAHAIENGRLRGDELSFTANGVGYTGHVNGDAIEGQTATGSWRATRTRTPAPAGAASVK